jgi:hypothetical protein
MGCCSVTNIPKNPIREKEERRIAAEAAAISKLQLALSRRFNRISVWATCFALASAVGVIWSVYEARTATIEANRAWIAPIAAEFAEEPKAEAHWIVRIKFHNVGRDPALGTVWKLDGVSIPGSSAGVETGAIGVPPNQTCSGLSPPKDGRSAFPDHEYTTDYTFTSGHLLDKVSVLNNETTLFMHGCFAYKTFAEPHTTEFCFYAALPNKAIDHWHWNFCPGGNSAN